MPGFESEEKRGMEYICRHCNKEVDDLVKHYSVCPKLVVPGEKLQINLHTLVVVENPEPYRLKVEE